MDAHRPNIILITSHDIGRRLGCYGISEARTPHLDQLANSGTRFTQAFTPQSQCSPARASLYTGRYPHSNGVMGLTHGTFMWELNEDEVHLAQRLRAAGYQTRLAGLQHETRRDLSLHFDQHERRTPWAKGNVDVAIEYLDEFTHIDKPFYLQIGFFEGHRSPGHERHEFGPMDPLDPDQVVVPAYMEDSPAALAELSQLDGSVASMDVEIGRLMQHLETTGLQSNTLVIFTVDHGIPFARAKTSSYDPGHEVALIWNGPKVPCGRVLEGQVSHIDFVPSLCQHLGLEYEENIEGESYWENIRVQKNVDRAEIFFEMTQHNYLDVMRSIRTPQHKLIINFVGNAALYNSTQQYAPMTRPIHPGMNKNNQPEPHPAVELYDLTNDPNEMCNLAHDASHQDTKNDLLKRLYRHLVQSSDPVLKGIPTPPSWHQAMALFETHALA